MNSSLFNPWNHDLLFIVAEGENERCVVGPSLRELALESDLNPVLTLQ